MNQPSSSVTRQIEHGKAYALKKGWTVPDELIFVDDGISGAEYIKRPGFIRLMNTLKPKPPFQFLTMSEESRLGRESIETSYALKQITDANVRVFFYLEDRERTLDNAMDKVMLSLSSFASEMERERGKQRTYDAMLRKAKAGHVTGGTTYGYNNHNVCSSEGKRLHVVRVVNQNEAAMVRQIFGMYAGGLGITRIAKRLNDEGVPAPRQSPRGWCPNAVREMLHRPLYRGQIIWNEMEKIVRGGTKKRRRRPDKERIIVEAPELRIIPPDLWESVHARLARTKERTGRLRDVESKYLLTGMARCSQCGGPMMVVGPGTSRRQGRYYGCAYHKKRGSSICKNSLLAEQEMLDQVLLRSLANVLHEQVIDQAIEQTLIQLRSQHHSQLDRRTHIERELSLIEAIKVRLVNAIKKGEGAVEPLLASLSGEESRKKDLIAELDRLDRVGPTELDTARLKREFNSRLADLPALLSGHVSEGRRLLRLLFEEPIQCRAVVEGNNSRYVLSGTGNFMNLLPSSAAHSTWCPQRD
ncbi:MAG: recombinase family protein [Nitrospira sp.]|nr:recombinase family protein [Nitrospira sp.]